MENSWCPVFLNMNSPAVEHVEKIKAGVSCTILRGGIKVWRWSTYVIAFALLTKINRVRTLMKFNSG